MKIMMAYFENLSGLTGGLERTLCRLSNELHKRGHDVSIITYDENNGLPYYPLDSTIKLINLKSQKSHNDMTLLQKLGREWARLRGKKSFSNWKEKQRSGIISNIKAVYDEIKPDVILAYNYQTMGELFRANIKNHVIALFRNDPDQLCPKMTDIELKSINSADAIQVLLPVYVDTIKKYISNDDVFCIPNAIEQCNLPVNLNQHQAPFTLLNVGRINRKQKRQMMLLMAFNQISKEFPDWQLKFWGDGDKNYKKSLEEFIVKNKLQKRAFLMGKTHKIMEEYQSADIFCFPSRYEGFPNALGEAMTSGLPPIVCRDCLSCRSLIEDKKDGVISEGTVDGLANSMRYLMSNPNIREQIGQNAHKKMEKFEPDHIWDMWEDLISHVSEK